MKARTKSARLKQKRGRPQKEGVERTPEGRISRSVNAKATEEKLMLEVATWKRRQIDPSLTVEEARKPEHGSVIAKWLENHKGFQKRYGDKPNPHEFTQRHHDTARSFHELHDDYLSVIAARRQRSSSEFNSVHGHDNTNPFERDIARKHAAIEEAYRNARRAILESGPLGMMAVETIVIENKEVERLRADLRCALNSIARLVKIRDAA